MTIHHLLSRPGAIGQAMRQAQALSSGRAAGPDQVHARKPRVSFIVTSYNYARYIVECLRSVLAQTYDNWECVVVDDASCDQSVALVREFLEQNRSGERFRLLERAANGGQMEAFRDGLALSTGSFVVMLDADDTLLPDFALAHLRAHLTLGPTVAFTSSNQYQMSSTGEIIGGQHMDHQSKGRFRHVRATSFQRGFWVWATASSMMFRRSTLELVMPPPSSTFSICADYYIAHFCNLIGDSLLIPTIHGCYRRHGKNNFGSNPLLGNLNSVGDMRNHPPHESFRRAMVAHVLGNIDRFRPIFMEKGLVNLLLRMVKPGELPGLVKHHPEAFPRPLPYYLLQAWKCWWKKKTTPASEKFAVVDKPT
ncbi:hypothetical protein JCM15519_15090 [Fundidesulfovibrio butyratiphilus]